MDARNHGDSPHSDDLNYSDLSLDLQYFIQEKNLSKVCLMGHSMGGRAVMACAIEKVSISYYFLVLFLSF